MKRILVPTDFSPVADNALEYAINMAADFNSDIYLYHVYSFDKTTYDIAFPKYDQPYAKEMERQMRKTESRFFEKAREMNVRIRTFVEEDTLFSLFKTKVRERQIDLIVMGSKGASGLSKFIFGNVAAKAIEMAEAPVLVVPPGHGFCPVQNIILCIDQKRPTAQMLLPLRNLAVHYGARVTMLNVRTDPKKHANITSVPPIDGVETSYREIQGSHSIGESINSFIQDEYCDILCMIRREKTFFEKVFKKSITRVQVFSNKAPLLVLTEG